jgi:hypothetical protein
MFPDRRVEPITAPTAAPPTTPRTTLFVMLRRVRRFTSSRLTSESATDCTPFGPRSVSVSWDITRKFPLTRIPGREAVMRRMDSPDLREAICWETATPNGATNTEMKSAIPTGILFVGLLNMHALLEGGAGALIDGRGARVRHIIAALPRDSQTSWPVPVDAAIARAGKVNEDRSSQAKGFAEHAEGAGKSRTNLLATETEV